MPQQYRQIPVSSTYSKAELLAMDKQFGQELIDKFLLEQREIGGESYLDTQTNLAVMQKFQVVMTLAQTSAITSIRDILPSIEIDSIFTQERKNNYIEMVANYLTQTGR